MMLIVCKFRLSHKAKKFTMGKDTEIIEMQIENSFLEKLMIISETKEEASEAAKNGVQNMISLLNMLILISTKAVITTIPGLCSMLRSRLLIWSNPSLLEDIELVKVAMS